MNTSRFPGSSRYQRGAALIVGLIMLLLLTLIGVAGMRDTLLQEKMAGSMRDREVALQAAESALRAAETELGALTEPTFGNSGGMYDLNTGAGSVAMTRKIAGAAVAEKDFWNRDSVWTAANSVEYPFTLADVVEQPRYVIEKLANNMSENKSLYTSGSDAGFVKDITAGTEVPTIELYPDYRVTARGYGTTDGTTVILQSTFRRNQQ